MHVNQFDCVVARNSYDVVSLLVIVNRKNFVPVRTDEHMELHVAFVKNSKVAVLSSSNDSKLICRNSDLANCAFQLCRKENV